MDLLNNLRGKEFVNRLSHLKHIQRQVIERKTDFHRSGDIHVVYLLGHVSVCGGVKIILEHANELVKQGARVTLLAHFPQPDWFEIRADYLQIPFGIDLARGIPTDCDVVVATYWDQLGACVEACAAPVVYFEQGDFHLWDWEKVKKDQQQFIYDLYQLPPYVITCSKTGSHKIKEVFHRDSLVFHNALNDTVFYPKSTTPTNIYILGVGRDTTPFKRIPDIWAACQLVREKGYPVEFKWVTPFPPLKPMGTVVINPSQEELGNVYRQAWAYVCASEYETFPLPPLEAMACDTPVITTPNDGVKAYGVDGENCLFFAPGNTQALAETIIRLLEDSALYQQLQENGYKTASLFSWQKIIPDLKAFYENVASYRPVGINNQHDWLKVTPVEFTPTEQQAIEKLLAGTTADLMYLPFIYSFTEFSVVRWQLAFYRKIGRSGQVDFIYDFFKKGAPEEHPYSDALGEIQLQNYPEALTKFKTHLDKTNNPREAAVLLRWITWCLLKLGRYREAHSLINKGIQSYPDFSDFYYLYGLVFKHLGFDIELQAMKNRLKALGDGAGFPEYIKDIATLTL